MVIYTLFCPTLAGWTVFSLRRLVINHSPSAFLSVFHPMCHPSHRPSWRQLNLATDHADDHQTDLQSPVPSHPQRSTVAAARDTPNCAPAAVSGVSAQLSASPVARRRLPPVRHGTAAGTTLVRRERRWYDGGNDGGTTAGASVGLLRVCQPVWTLEAVTEPLPAE